MWRQENWFLSYTCCENLGHELGAPLGCAWERLGKKAFSPGEEAAARCDFLEFGLALPTVPPFSWLYVPGEQGEQGPLHVLCLGDGTPEGPDHTGLAFAFRPNRMVFPTLFAAFLSWRGRGSDVHASVFFLWSVLAGAIPCLVTEMPAKCDR